MFIPVVFKTECTEHWTIYYKGPRYCGVTAVSSATGLLQNETKKITILIATKIIVKN
jgi:hypothetical protein